MSLQDLYVSDHLWIYFLSQKMMFNPKDVFNSNYHVAKA